MAEIQQNAAGTATPGKRRAKKMSTRIDMTPMVDLAFLLLTFFMLTTTFAKPTVMELAMPVRGPETPVAMSRTLTILLGKAHQVYYYTGLNAAASGTPAPMLKTASFAATGIRRVLLDFQRARPGTVVLIKPSADSKYQDMVNILDEMNITNQKKYALVKISPTDVALLQTTKPAAL